MTTAAAIQGKSPAIMTSQASSTRPFRVMPGGRSSFATPADCSGAQKAQSDGAGGQSGGGLQPGGGCQPAGASGHPGAGRQIILFLGIGSYCITACGPSDP